LRAKRTKCTSRYAHGEKARLKLETTSFETAEERKMSSYLPALPDAHDREGIGYDLQATLAELIDLSLIGKQVHWAVTGPLFSSLHLQLDELVDSWRELADIVAERAVALGIVPDGQVQTVAAASQLTPLPRGRLEDRVAVREITRRLARVSESVRSRLVAIGETDLASQDVMIDVVRQLEKQQWMLRVQLSE
jgi:starvation-inducible DNA-binding protein